MVAVPCKNDITVMAEYDASFYFDSIQQLRAIPQYPIMDRPISSMVGRGWCNFHLIKLGIISSLSSMYGLTKRRHSIVHQKTPNELILSTSCLHQRV